ncbi:type II toxin-antitoxin system RelE family toxin [Sphaerospermopsis torques-reginae]|jgi:mRNA interferase RelE/StbE|uniref:Type II toxin-antitoxin system RelE/ParE family toxin n=1 Tax=Sphaerospermopsis torques-reginae ITEP-024 TaxID=984208 RepID=A0ABX8WY12_9CYAN|nr:type II toxin-antitoxin system RelE/ParE family toxin [Sphaerospermopsis torques-reginae]QYX31252.1 type II toxin-antitoxin system RelE/ParE family toxin [Sphaerospermopsis torques-reginae ITEP-024]
MSYKVIIPKPVQKQLDNLQNDVSARVLEKILSLAEDPRPSGVKKLKGFDNEYRIRIGDYRVRYEIDDQTLTVIVLHCLHRKDVYKQ